MKKILLLSQDNEIIDSFTNYYKDSSFYNVKIYKENKKDINYDVIVIDYYLEKDTYDFIKLIKDNTLVFLILPDVKINMYPIFKYMNINYIFYKPICISYIAMIINIFYEIDNTVIDPFRMEIIKIFNELGLSFKLLGTQYLYEILILLLCNSKSINNSLYTIISERHNVVEENVIKNISYAISTCFNKGGNEELKHIIFGYCYSELTGSITNYNFLHCLYIYIMNTVIEKSNHR